MPIIISGMSGGNSTSKMPAIVEKETFASLEKLNYDILIYW